MAPDRWVRMCLISARMHRHTGQIYLEDLHEVLLGVLIQRDERPGHAGVVERRIEPAERRYRTPDGSGHRPEVPDVRYQRFGAGPEPEVSHPGSGWQRREGRGFSSG